VSEVTQRACALEGCTNEFTPKRSNQIYCHASHGQRAAERRKRSGVGTTAPTAPTAQVGDPVSRVEVQEAEIKELRKHVAAARKLEVFDHRALSLLERTVDALEPRYERVELPKDGDMTTHKHVLLWSDLHAAERVSYESMNGMNEYNWDIMNSRLATMQRAVVSFNRNRPYPIDDLHILGLGDQVTGDIHDELRETNELVCTESAVQLGLDSAEFIAGFAPYYRNIYVDAVVGNHGRVTQKPEFKNPHKNWDWISYKIMELRLKDYENIVVTVPKSFEHIVQVFDRNILMFHGDGIPTNMPGVPWGGVQRRTKELFDSWMSQGTFIDYFAFGHFHEANVLGQKRLWGNGSVKGPDEYSKKKFGGGRPACQLLMTLHPERGVTDVSFLNLQ
jgi:hypothetical protein